jgi:D-galactarolactone cycloisomerase
MKITRVRSHVLEARLSQPFASSRTWYDRRTAHVVEVETDQGVIEIDREALARFKV